MRFDRIPLNNFPPTFVASRNEKIFPKNWTTSSCPVIFDFLGTEQASNKDARNYLYCLLPQLKIINDAFFFFVLSRNNLQELCIKGTIFPFIRNYVINIKNKITYTVDRANRTRRSHRK